MQRPATIHHLDDTDSLPLVSAVLADASAGEPLALVVPGRQRVVLPDAVRVALTTVVEMLERNQTVTITASQQTLSTQEAADLLRVSRTTFVRLLRDGEIAYTRPNKHRRIRLDDLIDYVRRQRNSNDGVLADIVALTRTPAGADATHGEIEAAPGHRTRRSRDQSS